MRQLYFDHNATTPLPPSVQEAVLPFLKERHGDPASFHASGRACHEAVEDARGHVALLLGCDAEEVVFTSGGTESNNLALKGIASTRGRSAGGHFVISAIEHPSVVESARFLERQGFDLTCVPVTGQGVVQPAAITRAIRGDTLLVSIMLANHEVGALQPIKQIAEACHAAGVPLHTDASQAVGKIRTQVDELQVDLLTVSGHKMCAPKGVGALYVRQGVTLDPIMHGTDHEAGLRAGTPNVAGIVGLGAAAVLVAKTLDASQDRLQTLRDKLLALLRSAIGEELVVHAERAPRLPNTLTIAFPQVCGHELLTRVPELCAWSGSFGKSDAPAISPTLAAMGVTSELAQGTIRLSLGWHTSADDVEWAASLLLGAWEALRP